MRDGGRYCVAIAGGCPQCRWRRVAPAARNAGRERARLRRSIAVGKRRRSVELRYRLCDGAGGCRGGAGSAPAGKPDPHHDLSVPRESGQRYGLRQMASMVPSVVHAQPDMQAVRQVALARKRGFEAIRNENREIWADLWKGRIRLVGAEPRWQALADAAFFYIVSSTHVGSTASTSIFGLATWHDYHYYYGHVMWDIETFIVPVLTLLQPHTAASLLDYRFRNLPNAAGNARLRGRRGLQFPWESAPSTGQGPRPCPDRRPGMRTT